MYNINNKDLIFIKALQGNKIYTPFFVNLSTKESSVINESIFPSCFNLKENSLLDEIKNHIEYVYYKDIELFTLFYSNIINLAKLCKADTPIELVIRLKDDNANKYFKYKFIFSFSLETENSSLYMFGSVYKEPITEELNESNADKINQTDSYQIFCNHANQLFTDNKEKKYAFIQFDIEKFKIINDIYGEDFGDEIISYICDFFNIFIKDKKCFLHCFSDIFNILYEYKDEDSILKSIKIWEDKINKYKNVEYRLNWGVYLIDNKDQSIRAIMDSAAFARQSIKGNALNNIGFYHAEQKEKIKKIKEIEEKANNALKNNEFKMFLQPKYDISKNKIVGAESLVRWIDDDGNMIMPDEFIPIFEQNGFIIELDKFMWESACKCLKSWTDKRFKLVPISINISRKHLNSCDFIDFLDNLLKKYHVPQKYLELEITETIENINSNAILKELKNRGYTLLMDDFGSGYSSLNNLKSTDFDIIKIDKSFLNEFMKNSKGQKIISHTLAMINDINLNVIAEGVETKEQATFLKDNGCEIAQGWLYSKAVSVPRFEELLKNNQQGGGVDEN